MVLSSKMNETERHLGACAKCYYRGIYNSGGIGENLLEEMTSEFEGEK